HVLTQLTVPSLNHATVTAKTSVRNDSANSAHIVVSGTVAGSSVSQTLDLAAHQTSVLTFPVSLDNPRVWWPAGMGGQPLYDADPTPSVSGNVSATAHERFGIRDVKSSVNGNGSRTYTINGRSLLIRGGGWSPDLFLRWNAKYTTDRLKYALDLGLNTIR